ncbi:MAG TPA: PLP-dependent lyase/thiolase [Blastocatellia bacterium]|nr:PLP-dependent lyase/thiolase [Blastocatellia bacterium]
MQSRPKPELHSSTSSPDDQQTEASASPVSSDHKRRHFKVGKTPIFKNRQLSDYFSLQHLTMKDESYNHFGTHKDRKSLSIVNQILRDRRERPTRCPEALCLVTAGNAGLSLVHFAEAHDLPVISFVGEGRSHQELERKCERVISLDLTRWWSSKELRGRAGGDRRRRVRDVSNCISSPYQTIVDEICREMNESDLPDVIVMPFGCGELFRGIEQGLLAHRLKTRLIGVAVDEIASADKLYDNFSRTGRSRGLPACRQPHRIVALKNEQLLWETYRKITDDYQLTCEPSSAVPFAALHEFHYLFESTEKVMVINTGTFNHQRAAGVDDQQAARPKN